MPSFAGSNAPLASTLPVASSSMTAAGGRRPPVPIVVAAGSGLPWLTTTTLGDAISVTVRLALLTPPGRNSCTSPPTVTASPTVTAVGAEPVKTKIPSEVASLESGSGSWR